MASGCIVLMFNLVVIVVIVVVVAVVHLNLAAGPTKAKLTSTAGRVLSHRQVLGSVILFLPTLQSSIDNSSAIGTQSNGQYCTEELVTLSRSCTKQSSSIIPSPTKVSLPPVSSYSSFSLFILYNLEALPSSIPSSAYHQYCLLIDPANQSFLRSYT